MFVKVRYLSGWLLVLSVLGACVPAAGEDLSALEFRHVTDNRLSEEGTPIPRDAVRVFPYEGTPKSVGVTDSGIAVDYGLSGCLFDRETGQLVQRFTVADGWPVKRPEGFAAPAVERPHLVGPGILESRRGPSEKGATPEVAAEIQYRGETWRALQPKDFLNGLSRNMDWGERMKRLNGWTPILEILSQRSFVERGGAAPGEGRKYTTDDGLAGNIVTGFAAASGKLWAECLDIYDPDKNAWGPGGLSWFDEGKDRWTKVDEIGGHPVRFVTLLQTIGDELWVGFREGTGVEGDSIVYGMGIFVGDYRPKITAVTLARLADGKWTVYSRPPRQDPPIPSFSGPEQRQPTERPARVVVSGDSAVLFSQVRSVERSYSYDLKHDGLVSMCDLGIGEWKVFDLYKDFDADRLFSMVADNGEILVTSNRGVHQWLPTEGKWRFLDPECGLKNPSIAAVEPVGDELWVGYRKEGWGVYGTQGVSRFDDKTGRWSWNSPDEIGTACPMYTMGALPDGDVWALFHVPPEFSAGVWFPIYERERSVSRPEGLARYSEGAWSFPAATPDDVSSPDGREGSIPPDGPEGGAPAVPRTGRAAEPGREVPSGGPVARVRPPVPAPPSNPVSGGAPTAGPGPSTPLVRFQPAVPASPGDHWPGGATAMVSALVVPSMPFSVPRLPLRFTGLAVVGPHLFVSTATDLFMGPKPWDRIFSASPAAGTWGFTDTLFIEAAEDGKSLLVVCPEPNTSRLGPHAVKWGRYVPGDGPVDFEKVQLTDSSLHESVADPFFGDRRDSFQAYWARVQVTKEGEWVVGPFRRTPDNRKRVIQTDRAVWIVMPGQIVRLDRAKLSDWFAGSRARH